MHYCSYNKIQQQQKPTTTHQQQQKRTLLFMINALNENLSFRSLEFHTKNDKCYKNDMMEGHGIMTSQRFVVHTRILKVVKKVLGRIHNHVGTGNPPPPPHPQVGVAWAQWEDWVHRARLNLLHVGMCL